MKVFIFYGKNTAPLEVKTMRKGKNIKFCPTD